MVNAWICVSKVHHQQRRLHALARNHQQREKNTPSHAAIPLFAVDVRRCPSISRFIFRAVRHMWTINVATDAAAVSARTPSHND